MKVAVLGFGTVGQGVYGMLTHSKGLEPGPVLVRPGKDNEPWKVADMNAIVSDATVGAVAEVIEGVVAGVNDSGSKPAIAPIVAAAPTA